MAGRPQHKHAGDCEYCLVPTTSTADVQEYNFDHVVLLVPANLEAVLAAYQRIKRLAQRNTPDIGLVLVGPANHHRNNFLARISERLLRSEFYTSYPTQKFDQGKG